MYDACDVEGELVDVDFAEAVEMRLLYLFCGLRRGGKGSAGIVGTGHIIVVPWQRCVISFYARLRRRHGLGELCP